MTNKKQGSGAAQQAAPPPTAVQSATLSRVFAAWQKRQEHVKSFHFVWDTRVTLPKGDEFQPFQIISPPAQVWPGTVPIVLDKTTEFTVSQTEWWGQGDDRLRFDFPIVKNVGANHWNQVARVRLIRDGSIRSRLTVPSSPAQTLDDDLAHRAREEFGTKALCGTVAPGGLERRGRSDPLGAGPEAFEPNVNVVPTKLPHRE